MFKHKLKYFEELLNAEEDARQIRSYSNEVFASNKKGVDFFGTGENPFHYLKTLNPIQDTQKIEEAYCAQNPFQCEIQTAQGRFLIQIKKLKTGLLLIAKDISPSYALHYSLTHRLDFMSNVLSCFSDPIYLTDKNGVLIYVNKAFLTLLGTSLPNTVSQPISSFILDGTPHFEGFWQGTLYFKTPKGILPTDISQQPFETCGQTFFYGIIREINPLKHQNKYLFDKAPLPLAVIQAVTHQIKQTNDAFKNFVKTYQPDGEITNILEILSETSKETFVSKLKKMLQGLSISEKIDITTASKFASKTFNLFVTFSSAQKDNFLIYFVDATDQKNLERQFAHGQKMQAIGQLAGGIAHDFNNLLTAIIGFCDLLLEKHPASDPTFMDILQIKGNANKAAGLVGQLLTFSKKQPAKVELINFHDAFIDISSLLNRSISPFVSLKTSMQRNLGSVKMESNQLTQIFLNLAVNAKDAMKNGGNLLIAATKENLKKAKPLGNEMIQAGDYIKITVSDNGSGIEEEHLSHIFEPFFTTKSHSNVSGTGLGLSTVYGIIHSAGGYISVNSQKDIGTTFTIYLPRYEDKEEKVIKEKTIRPVFTPQKDFKILLVDDEDAVRFVTKKALTSKGFIVTDCENGENALKILAQQDDFDLLISDMVMQGMNGTTLIQKAKEAYPKLKTILMSGYSEDLFDQQNNKSFSNTEFLQKPFEIITLLDKVRETLED